MPTFEPLFRESSPLLSLEDLWGYNEAALMTPPHTNACSLNSHGLSQALCTSNVCLLRLVSAPRGQGTGQGFFWGSLWTSELGADAVSKRHDLLQSD